MEIFAVCAYIIRMRGLCCPVAAAAVVVHVSGSLCKKHYIRLFTMCLSLI